MWDWMLCRWNHLYVTPQYSSEKCHALMRSVLLLPNICAPRALCKHLISYGLLYNTSLVNNVPLLIRERRLIEQISAGWDDKPCQAPKRLQITMMQCIPHIGLSCVCCISALFCHPAWVQVKPSAKLGRKIFIHLVLEEFQQKFHIKTWLLIAVFGFSANLSILKPCIKSAKKCI